MRDNLVWFFDAIKVIPWLELIKSLAPVATAFIAYIALRNWKRQDKARREAEFLDLLVETTHTYIAVISKPITLFEKAKISMACHTPTWEDGDEADKAVKGAIAYIDKRGENDAKPLQSALEYVQPATIKLRSLAVKGQVFEFKDYAKCQNAVALLTRHFDRISAFMAVIESPTWNWENPEVLNHLKNVMAIEPVEIRKSVQDNNASIIEFARDTYKQIYG